MSTKRSNRLRWLIPLLLVVLAPLFIALVLQSTWFANLVRDRIVSATEHATGGHVELESFVFRWRTLTAELHGFVLHGTESKTEAPLFHADGINVRIIIRSILRKDIDLSSITVDKPLIHFVVNADGSTNFPHPQVKRPQTDVMQQLLRLKIGHFELRNGALQVNLERTPLDVRGEHLDMQVAYNSPQVTYGLRLAMQQVRIDTPSLRPLNAELSLAADVGRTFARVNDMHVKFKNSDLFAQGVVNNFAQPDANLQIRSSLNAAEVGTLVRLPEIRSGHLDVTGDAVYNERSSFQFNGRIKGNDLSYRSREFGISRASVQSPLHADLRHLTLPSAIVSVAGSRIETKVAFENYRYFLASGKISGFDVEQARLLVGEKPLPWSATATGTFDVRGTLGKRTHDFVINAATTLSPAAGPRPVSGAVNLTYRESDNTVDLADSNLRLPNSTVDVSGILGRALDVNFTTSDLTDLQPIFDVAHSTVSISALPLALKNGRAVFRGVISGSLDDPALQGQLTAEKVLVEGELLQHLTSDVSLASSGVKASKLVLTADDLHASGDLRYGLDDWKSDSTSPIELHGRFNDVELTSALKRWAKIDLPQVRGVAQGTIDLKGTVARPNGQAQVAINGFTLSGEQLNHIAFVAQLKDKDLSIANGHVDADDTSITFSGRYRHEGGSWRNGQAQVALDSDAFPLKNLLTVRQELPALNALLDVHGKASAQINGGRFKLLAVDARSRFRHITIRDVAAGNLDVVVSTANAIAKATINGDLQQSVFAGNAQLELAGDYPVHGSLQTGHLDLPALTHLLGGARMPLAGFLEGNVSFDGLARRGTLSHLAARINQLQLQPAGVARSAEQQKIEKAILLRNAAPILIDSTNDVATIHPAKMIGPNSAFNISGTLPLSKPGVINLKLDGNVDLQIVQSFNTNLQTAGTSNLQVSVGGTYDDPAVNGTVTLQRASLFLNDLSNGISALNGAIKFNKNRATIQQMTARSGGGDLQFGGFVNYGAGGPLIYRLEANGRDVRVRYAGGVSVTANSELRLTGTSDNSLLSGSTTVTRAAFNPSTDVGSLLAASSAPKASPTNERGFFDGVQLDVHVESAPNLQLTTSLSQDVQAEIDLRLRGTPDRPSVLGHVAANEGIIRVFGAKYTINRGEINFFDPAKIEPVLDLDLVTQTRGISVDITVSGKLSKLNINYRSDPPLLPRDIVALLTVGRSPDAVTNLGGGQVTNDTSALRSGANTVLGQAISPVSNRLSKLFGITNIKIDPLVQGITNTPQARLTVEQQVSRDITVTYITNLSQTSEQIFRMEWALSRQYSIIALRDDNGEFGIDVQFKKRFK